MSENTVQSSELTSQYLNQVTSDLERNVKEQERITAEISALQHQLATLQHDHTVLVNMQRALGTSAAAEPAETAGTTVPSPRKKTSPAPGTRKRGKKSDAEQTSAKKRPAKKSAAKNAGPSTARPTLTELIRRHLAEQSEPRSAAEVATALGQSHPDRTVKTTVVRTSLENLVAKNQAQRTKQGTSVFYTAVGPAEQTAASEAGARQETAG
ncbi:BlaI/MecI/CopY family transcriptional regulator [Streptomyces sp. NPDC052701]|uniref:BlaI/MecI/CopY family transcriptional regulator n=1 Tax=Streptomyces sp. NPDC052701 TaxID=3155533 RepID=UPI003434E050